MTGQANDTFDPAAVGAALAGTWSYPATEEPTGLGYLHFTDDGQIIQFVYDTQRPEKRIPLRLWYSVESASTLRLRPKGNPEGWTCDYRFDGPTLIMTNARQSFPCSRTSPGEVPDWFREAIAQRLSRP
jgi:hypothetical protein